MDARSQICVHHGVGHDLPIDRTYQREYKGADGLLYLTSIVIIIPPKQKYEELHPERLCY